MKITRKHLSAAVEKDIISQAQADVLVDFLRGQPGTGPSFDFTHILYYLGGMIAIGAMTLFMTLGWQTFGGWGIFFISLIYAVIGLWITNRLRDRGHAVPAGICAAFVVALTPLAVYGLQKGLGWWPDDSAYRAYHYFIQWHWIFMELATLAAGAVMAWRYRYPFLLMPVAVTLWYMSMDVAVMLTGGEADWQFRAFFSMWFGLVIILLGFWIDVRSRASGDYAFWLYLFGVLAFWGGLTSQQSDSELNKFLYFCVNLLLIGVGAVLVRRVFVVFGALGSAIYLGHLASTVFEDSWLFPFVLTAIGLWIVYMGIVWQRHEKQITATLRQLLPQTIRELLDARSA